ncbi:MAG: hypothetical protein L3V56_06535 [Candidatus Magnetoovum sp. WYHC-5]|nr:hypothetical protein [Candidatus Magnetoovum sp. WYHC-5]
MEVINDKLNKGFLRKTLCLCCVLICVWVIKGCKKVDNEDKKCKSIKIIYNIAYEINRYSMLINNDVYNEENKKLQASSNKLENVMSLINDISINNTEVKENIKKLQSLVKKLIDDKSYLLNQDAVRGRKKDVQAKIDSTIQNFNKHIIDRNVLLIYRDNNRREGILNHHKVMRHALKIQAELTKLELIFTQIDVIQNRNYLSSLYQQIEVLPAIIDNSKDIIINCNPNERDSIEKQFFDINSLINQVKRYIDEQEIYLLRIDEYKSVIDETNKIVGLLIEYLNKEKLD